MTNDEPPERHLLGWFADMFGEESQQYRALAEKCSRNPGRISSAYRELLSGYASPIDEIARATVALTPDDVFDGIVVARNIPFTSICGHHFLPFFGRVDLGYEPGSMIVGLGKLPRMVEARARRITIQEFLARDICQDLMQSVGAAGAFVRTTARHLCVCSRGPYKEGSLKERTQL